MLDQIDAVIWRQEKGGKICGLANILSQPGKYGSNPVVEAPKELVDFLYELGILCHVKTALIIKFRDKTFYWRIDEPETLSFINNMKRGKSFTVYQIPIQQLKQV